MNISDDANAYAEKAHVLRVNRRLPPRVSFLSLSIDHVLHLPPAHRMKEKMRVYLQELVMISYIRLTYWCNDFAKIPHLEKSRGQCMVRWTVAEQPRLTDAVWEQGRNTKMGICLMPYDAINI